MAPIEVIRGVTPEGIKEKFNKELESKGWVPISRGKDDSEEPHFLLIYRPPGKYQVIVSESLQPEFEPVIVELTKEKIEKARDKIKEIFSRGKFGPTLIDRFRDKAIKEGPNDALVFLFPEPSNQPIARLFASLYYRGQIETVTDLLNFPSEYIYGIGEKSRFAIEEVKKILLEK